ncbi:hypothetical protein IFR05_011518 [Cadophora sp. M221]|nr:hypothetical protein IFR05_011518 [Cadophora sp. M221]
MTSTRSPSSPPKALKNKLISLSSSQPTVTVTHTAKSKTKLTPDLTDLTPPPQTVIIHKGFITHYSKFFAGAFSGTSTEALTHKMHDKKDFRVNLIVELYDIAKKFGMLKLQNDVISLLRWAMTDESVVTSMVYFTRCATSLCENGETRRTNAYLMAGSMIWGSEAWIRMNCGARVSWLYYGVMQLVREYYDLLPEEYKMNAPEAEEFHVLLEG